MDAIKTNLIIPVTADQLQAALDTGIVTIEPQKVILKHGKKSVALKFDGADFVYGSNRKKIHIGVMG